MGEQRLAATMQTLEHDLGIHFSGVLFSVAPCEYSETVLIEWSDGPSRDEVLRFITPRVSVGVTTIMAICMRHRSRRGADPVPKSLLTLSCGHQKAKTPFYIPDPERYEVCSTPISRFVGDLERCNVCPKNEADKAPKQIVMFHQMIALP